ncbi:acetyl-CoA carboxylase biotin carboxyl carrier protein [Paenisporosarcina cavernae]|uniref:Biotin carboxyl carrier protein of acetyl-CoA carboxylase n=1 Tax=Paenisporosarcina cavernae TaxID=2320858 RepID=A0A385YVL2_9BACL|nr:acetyl-CoA carboxylase biotin carboxyl carrier protein [Paenisporosarcina cavernae]AYC29543.1 acetyl-CoA carboxylase biotin carboxyl carrier protein [Paenisporosarcina cavernae]
MLKIQEIREIIKLIDHSSIDEFVFESEGSKVKLKKNATGSTIQAPQGVSSISAPVVPQPQPVAVTPTPAAAQTAPSEQTSVEKADSQDESLLKITSPMVGTFYQASSPETPAFVQVGDKVSADSVVCIVEAMKLFNEIEAEVSGEIVEILVKDGQLVEYGQALFLVKAN